jgi:fimbrial isopeptide formation D2 family protein/LPXTG-motif cell wall-anchored protein
MKTKAKKLVTLILTALLVLSILPMNVFAAQKEVTAGSKASITVENAVENDVLAAYKVVDIAYNAANNTLSYAWNSAFTDYFAGTTSYNTTAYTVEQFGALTDNPDTLKTLLAGLPKYIANKSITPVDTQTVAVGGTATFANLAMGEYFIRPTSTTSVYQLMLQKVEPTVAEVDGKQTYVIDDLTFSAKHKEVSVDKAANKTSVTKNEKVTYTITVDIPTYASQAVDKSFYVSDLLPDGLTIDTDSIKVQIDATDVDASNYTLDKTATNDYTFKLSVDTDKYAERWSAKGGKQLVITYTATLNDDNTTAVNAKETNTVTFDYSNYPYVENSHAQKTDTVDVTTFAIKIDKYVDGEPTNKLANAKFDLYRTATQAEVNAGLAVTIPHTAVNGIKLEGDLVTDANGTATFAKYEANGEKYDYYLVETQAPSGYNLLDNAVKVNFTDADVEATAGVYTVKVSNSSGIQLPITGGTGTVIFTIIGIALMVGAVVLFVVSRKKAKESK